MLTRVLVANRGEIAVRILHACREHGLETVAVYADPDAHAKHTLLADRAVRIGPAAPADSYLSIDALMRAAADTGADALHPGYGFLSERAALARACEERGITFIGPGASAIEKMGSKISARATAIAAGVPVVPGITPREQSGDAIADAVRSLELPVLLKPAAGGGGIGMKVVRHLDDLDAAIAQAQREAAAAFGDGTLYVERLIERARHVEIQVMADIQGNMVHLFERECSVQRRHQKVIEESPSPAMTADLRRSMGEAAVSLAKAVGYQNAGTVEFLVEGTGKTAAFYFLEMNTRLQVEHPVTEQVTGVDLVQAQLTVAAGERLPWSQDTLAQRGHAIEARIYAEDPARGDVPHAGRLLLYREPSMPGIRIDSGVVEGDTISVHYDPMIAKVIATGSTRDAARRRLIGALEAFPILGVATNVSFLLQVLRHRRFVDGDVDTAWLTNDGDEIRDASLRAPDDDVRHLVEAVRASQVEPSQTVYDAWTALRGTHV